MKIDVIKSIIAVGFSVLLAYASYWICKFEHLKWVIAIGAFLTLVIPAMLALGLSAKQERGAVMLKTLSWIFFFAEIIVNGVFAFCNFSIPIYVIINGLMLLAFALI